MALKADGELITKLRLDLGWSSAQLAEQANVSRVHVWRIEEGWRLGSPGTRLKIARALGVPVSHITREETPDEADRRKDRQRREKQAA